MFIDPMQKSLFCDTVNYTRLFMPGLYSANQRYHPSRTRDGVKTDIHESIFCRQRGEVPEIDTRMARYRVIGSH